MTSIAGPVPWIVFAAVILTMLAIDLGIFNRKAHVIRFREAAVWSGVWVSLALGFNGLVFARFGTVRGLEFFQAWLVEKALSVDNIFVFLAIFSYFQVAERVQHRILFWGIFGALLTRGVFIGVGASLISSFHFVMYVFGVFLILTAGRLLVGDESEIHPDKNPVLRLFRRFVPIASDYTGTGFWVKRDGRWMATSLLLVMVVVEATDVVFAVDSIPAVFGITQDVFIVYTSNIFAILGLRAMSFMVSSLIRRLRYLKVGLSLVLAFVGVKMLIEGYVRIPELISLGVVLGLLLGAAGISLLRPEAPARECGREGEQPPPDERPSSAKHPTSKGAESPPSR